MRKDMLKIDFDFKREGVFLMFGESDGVSGFICENQNDDLTLVSIVNDYWKDYRYANTGTIDINGSASAVQNTVRNMVAFPPVQFSEEAVGLTEFPDDIGSLDWGGGVKSYITELRMPLDGSDAYVITAESRLLDL